MDAPLCNPHLRTWLAEAPRPLLDKPVEIVLPTHGKPADRAALEHALSCADARPSAAFPCRGTWLVPLAYTWSVTGLRGYWRWLGHRLWLSQPGRALFTVALLVGVAEMTVARAHGDREGGAPLVVLTLLLLAVVTLDAVGRGVVTLVRRLVVDGGPRRRS